MDIDGLFDAVGKASIAVCGEGSERGLSGV